MTRRTGSLTSSLALAMAVSAGACSDELTLPTYELARPGWDSHVGDFAAGQVLSGQYQLESKFEIDATKLFPDVREKALRSLAALGQDAAKTMRMLADQPVLNAVLAAVPPSMDIDDAINDWVAGQVFDSMSAPSYVAKVVDRIEGMFADFRLITTASLAAPDETGDSSVRHKLSGIDFEYGDESVRAWVPKFLDTSAGPAIDSQAIRLDVVGDRIEDARWYLGDHALSVPIGKLAMAGVNQALSDIYHLAGLRSVLGQVVDCGGMAAQIGDDCSGASCSALETAVEALCEHTLDRVIDDVTQRLAVIQIGTVRFIGGEAAMYDATQDGVHDGKIDRIERGHWDLALSRAVLSSSLGAAISISSVIEGDFIGARIGDYDGADSPGADIPRNGDNARFVDDEHVDLPFVLDDPIDPPASAHPALAVDAEVGPPVLGGVKVLGVVPGPANVHGGTSAIDASRAGDAARRDGERIIE